jgi:uncharacterized caspase-like protein
VLRAVIIGINEYQDESINNLNWARNDAKELVSLLTKSIQSSQLSIRVLLDSEATRDAIMKAIGEDLPRAEKAEDIILLYFAGHGSPESQDSPHQASRYLIAHDTKYNSIFSTGIDMERDVKALLERCHRAKVVLFFLDACFSGLAGGRTFQGPRLRQYRSEMRSPAGLSLKKLALGRGRVLMAACTDHQVALENFKLQHGIFTYHLIQALMHPNHEDVTVSVAALYNEVAEAVQKMTKGTQVPVLKGEVADVRPPRLSR